MDLYLSIVDEETLKACNMFELGLRIYSHFATQLDTKKVPSEVASIALKVIRADDFAPYKIGHGFPVAVRISPREEDKTLLDGKTVFIYRNSETGEFFWHYNEDKNGNLEEIATAVVDHLIKWLEE